VKTKLLNKKFEPSKKKSIQKTSEAKTFALALTLALDLAIIRKKEKKTGNGNGRAIAGVWVSATTFLMSRLRWSSE